MKKKIVLILILTLCMCFILTMFTGACAENTTSITYRTNIYSDMVVHYFPSSLTSTLYVCNWYFDFSFTNDTINFATYYFDTSTVSNWTSGNMSIRFEDKLLVSKFDYFNSSDQRRRFDYLLEYEQLQPFTELSTSITAPTTVEFKYTDIQQGEYSIHPWTVKDQFSLNDNTFCLKTVTFANSYYRLSFTQVVKVAPHFITDYFYKEVEGQPTRSGAYQYQFYTTYYLNGNNSLSYSQGYDSGFTAGQLNGVQIADGRVNEQSASYSSGYYAGTEDANEYTFTKLLSAVIDAPVNAGLELFNFDLLGINMRGFITALFTLAIIIIVIKFVLVK